MAEYDGLAYTPPQGADGLLGYDSLQVQYVARQALRLHFFRDGRLQKLHFAGTDTLWLQGVPHQGYAVGGADSVVLYLMQYPVAWQSELGGSAALRFEGSVSGRVVLRPQSGRHLAHGWLVPQLHLKHPWGEQALQLNDTLHISHNKLLLKHSPLRGPEGEVQLHGIVSLEGPSYHLQVQSEGLQLAHTWQKTSHQITAHGPINAQLALEQDALTLQVTGKIQLLPGCQLRYSPQDALLSDEQPNEQQSGLLRFANAQKQQDSTQASNPKEIAPSDRHIQARITVHFSPGVKIDMGLPNAYHTQLTLHPQGQLVLNKLALRPWQAAGSLVADSGLLSDNRLIKELPLDPGSHLLWEHYSLQPQLHLRATIHRKASPERLFAQELARTTAAEKMLYRRKLPFVVLAQLQGEAREPRFDFRLALPPEYQSSHNGQIHNKLQQINQSPYQAQLQATALLGFGRFEGSSLSDARVGALESATRQIAKLVASLTRNRLRGVQLRVDYFSYDDYGQVSSEPTRREFEWTVSKSFDTTGLVFDLGGVVTIENSATENIKSLGDRYQPGGTASYYFGRGSGYAQLFSYTSYTGILDGRVRETGIRLGISRSFNQLSELFWQKRTP